jgi:hypothetical protein
VASVINADTCSCIDLLLFSQNPNGINPRFQLQHRRAGALVCAPVELVHNPAGRWAAGSEWALPVPRAPPIARHSHSPLLPAQYRYQRIGIVSPNKHVFNTLQLAPSILPLNSQSLSRIPQTRRISVAIASLKASACGIAWLIRININK